MEATMNMHPVYTHHVKEVDALRKIVDKLAIQRRAESGPHDKKYACLMEMQLRLTALRILLLHPEQEIVRLNTADYEYLKKVCGWVQKNLPS